MKTSQYKRKPLSVEAVQVTKDNLYEIAKWCNGEVTVIQTNSLPFKVIKVPVLNPLSPRQQHAQACDWVLKSDTGFKVYTDRAFNRGFELEVDAELVEETRSYQ